MMEQKQLLFITIALLVGAGLSGGITYVIMNQPEEQIQPANYGISMDAGHVHIFRESTVDFRVFDASDCTDATDTSTCTGVSGQDVTVFYQFVESSTIREKSIEDGDVVDNGDGTYTFTRTFGDLGAHLMGLKFSENGFNYSQSFVLETSKAGGERFFDIGSDAQEYAFQIRWHASTGHIHADGDDVTFYIDLRRSINTNINKDQPWRNDFDYLVPNDLVGNQPIVHIMEGETMLHNLTVNYDGQGIFSVTQAFGHDMLGDEHHKEFWLHVSFEDLLDCQINGADDKEEYMFEVVADH